MTPGGLAVPSWGSWQTTLTMCEWSGERGGRGREGGMEEVEGLEGGREGERDG